MMLREMGSYTPCVGRGHSTAATAVLLILALLSVVESQGTGPCVPAPSHFTGKAMSPLPCEDIVVGLPFQMRFDGSQIGLEDQNGVSTGLRMYMPSTRRAESWVCYKKQKLMVDTQNEQLLLKALPGGWNGRRNSVRNAVGVGLPVPGQAVRLEVTVRMPEPIGIHGEQFCLFLGVSDLEFATLCAKRLDVGYEVSVRYEAEDKMQMNDAEGLTLGGANNVDREITLRMDVYPADAEIDTFYTAKGKPTKRLKRFSVSPLTLNVDQAGTDPALGSRTMGGFFALRVPTAVDHKFSVTQFDANVIVPPVETGSTPSQIDFNTWRIANVVEPTAIAWAGDRLWVANVHGCIYSIQFDATRTQEISRRILLPIGGRLVLGIAPDPAYATNGCLWLSHSSLSQTEGEANSGIVSKVCGTDLDSRVDVITGLPRALANHATNNLSFNGGKLYMAIGGNTASGAPNLHENFAFGTRPEQPLSAAIVEADVLAPGFNGACTPSQDATQMDATGIAANGIECDAVVYASGTRNVYDCEWHSNGKLYCPDNGIGGRGTFPTLPQGYSFGDSCDGIVDGAELLTNDPGIRDDVVYQVEMGAYYGHPNPSRNECVMGAGNPTGGQDARVPTVPVKDDGKTPFEVPQYPSGTQAHPNYRVPMVSLGKNRSPNGIIEYKSDKMCGALKGHLLMTWFSVEPQVRRVKLNASGDGVLNDGTLPRSSLATGGITLTRPLGITQDDDGNVFVAEFGADAIAIFNPKDIQCP